MERIIRRRAVCELVGLSYSSVYRRVRRGEFPAPIALGSGGQAIGWFEAEVREWLLGQRRVGAPGSGEDAWHDDNNDDSARDDR